MAQITVIAPTTAAVASSASVKINSGGYARIIVSADVLANSEEVDVYTVAGGTAKLATDITGTAQSLTASKNQLEFSAGPTYIFAKDATAGSCGVYVDLANLT
jgi:hypothetical protein